MSQNDLARFGVTLKIYVATLPRELGKAVPLETSDNFRCQGYENDAGAVVSWGPARRPTGARDAPTPSSGSCWCNRVACGARCGLLSPRPVASR